MSVTGPYAIERLRDLVEVSDHLPAHPSLEDALAAVDALYQAAKAITPPSHDPEKALLYVPTPEQVAALAAAVRRVEGE